MIFRKANFALSELVPFVLLISSLTSFTYEKHNTYISYAFGNHSLELNEEIAIQSIERQHVMLICLATSLFTCFHSFGGFFSKTG